MLKLRYSVNPTKEQAAHGLHAIMNQTQIAVAETRSINFAANLTSGGVYAAPLACPLPLASALAPAPVSPFTARHLAVPRSAATRAARPAAGT